MAMRAKSNLAKILDERGLSIRKCAELCDLKFETVRRMYNDDTTQYQRNTLGAFCEGLNCNIEDLIILVEDKED